MEKAIKVILLLIVSFVLTLIMAIALIWGVCSHTFKSATLGGIAIGECSWVLCYIVKKVGEIK